MWTFWLIEVMYAIKRDLQRFIGPLGRLPAKKVEFEKTRSESKSGESYKPSKPVLNQTETYVALGVMYAIKSELLGFIGP